MFVRFRRTRRLQASLIETRRIAGKVQQEHVAGLGSIDVELSVADRITFWQQLHPRLDRLSNRLDAEALTKVLGKVHARIPMVTIEEIRALQLENAEADERLWRSLAEAQTERAKENRQLAATIEQAAIEAEARAESARAGAEAAKDRVDRLKRGEVVAGGFGRPLDVERIFRQAGMTPADIKRDDAGDRRARRRGSIRRAARRGPQAAPVSRDNSPANGTAPSGPGLERRASNARQG